MSLTYFKRFRMEIDLGRLGPPPELPVSFFLMPWDPALLPAHAEAKYLSFRTEIDAGVFPCLGDYDGCLRLMREITTKDNFLPSATWLAVCQPSESPPLDLLAPGHQVARGGYGEHSSASAIYCGTVQGILDRSGLGAIQNLGIIPEYRNLGLGATLLLHALTGFRQAGLRRAFLEVTAQNEGAIRLYQRLGFNKVRTVYKAAEVHSLVAR